MPRPRRFSEPLTEEFPRVRVTEMMDKVVRQTAREYGIKVSDVVRACVANQLGLYQENSELVTEMLRGTPGGEA